MADFERPKRKALSDAELAEELSKFPSDHKGIERAQSLIASQQKLREQDAADLEAWFDQMRQRDDEFSRGLVQETLAELFPSSQSTPSAPIPEPTFTSEIGVVTRRSVVSQRLKLSQMGVALMRGMVLALVSIGVGDWLDVKSLDLLLAFMVGASAALIASHQLRSHDLHPLLRSAAVFGGRGVYVVAPLLLASLSSALIAAFPGESTLASIELEFGYQALAVLALGLTVLLSQLIPPKFHGSAFVILGLGAIGSLVSLGLSPTASLSGDWFWAAIAISIIGFLLLTFGTPHLRTSRPQDAAALGFGALLTLPAVFTVGYANQELVGILLISTLIFGLAAAGRDISAGVRSRLLGLSVLLGLVFSPMQELLIPHVISGLAATSILLVFDQLLRRQPLHLASLDTSYGFYGSFQLVSWSAVVMASLLPNPFFMGILPAVMNQTEWSLSIGIAVGLLFAIPRIRVIRAQDRELENIDPRNARLENLLGL